MACLSIDCDSFTHAGCWPEGVSACLLAVVEFLEFAISHYMGDESGTKRSLGLYNLGF